MISPRLASAVLLGLGTSVLLGCSEQNAPTALSHDRAIPSGSMTVRVAAADNAVVHWNELAVNAILADATTRTPSAAALYVAIVQAAIYDATMAIVKTHKSYASSAVASPRASVDAAVAAAAHDVLVEYFPAQQGSLDAAYAASLAATPDGSPKDDGIRIGHQVAVDIIALRAHDGRFATVAAPDGTRPGEWRRTASGAAVTPWTGQVTPFLVKSGAQFRPHGPNRLRSAEYATQLNETRLYGAKEGTPGLRRTPEQTEIARFWTDNTVGQYNRALRNLANERALSTAQSARLFAMSDLAGADAMITCWNTKFHYSFWRPITAIRLADTDGNPATTADPTWEPFSVTANHPEYTSGHACLTGAITRVLEEFLGTDRIDFTMDAAVAGTSARHFDTVRQLRDEVENARIYGGDHYRKGGSDGTKSGDRVARWGLERFFQPRTPDKDHEYACRGCDSRR
jgi:hypothetical protein